MVVSMALNFPFPNASPYGEEMVSVLDRSVETVNGLNVVGLTSLGVLIAGLYFLVQSLGKYHARFVILACLVSMLAPHYLANSFQKHFATGIYAISYKSDKGNCHFEMAKKTTLHAVCKLPLINYSQKDVRFTVELREKNGDNDIKKMFSLLNANAPYDVMLRAGESKSIKIERDIDVSHIKNHLESGELTSVNIIIKSGKKTRKL